MQGIDENMFVNSALSIDKKEYLTEAGEEHACVHPGTFLHYTQI